MPSALRPCTASPPGQSRRPVTAAWRRSSGFLADSLGAAADVVLEGTARAADAVADETG